MRKVFLAIAALLLGAVTLCAQAPTTPPPTADNNGQAGHTAFRQRVAAERQAWLNLTDEQRGEVRQLIVKQHQERKACRTSGTTEACAGLRQKQFTERQNLAQSIGLKHIPGPRMIRLIRRYQRRHPQGSGL